MISRLIATRPGACSGDYIQTQPTWKWETRFTLEDFAKIDDRDLAIRHAKRCKEIARNRRVTIEIERQRRLNEERAKREELERKIKNARPTLLGTRMGACLNCNTTGFDGRWLCQKCHGEGRFPHPYKWPILGPLLAEKWRLTDG